MASQMTKDIQQPAVMKGYRTDASEECQVYHVTCHAQFQDHVIPVTKVVYVAHVPGLLVPHPEVVPVVRVLRVGLLQLGVHLGVSQDLPASD